MAGTLTFPGLAATPTSPPAGQYSIYVKTATGLPYLVNSAGAESVLGSAVTSVFGRTGAIIAVANDYSWAQINKTVSSLADITTRSHTDLTDKGTNTHAQLDSHLSSTLNPHSVTKAQVGLTNVEDTALSTWAGSANITTVGTLSAGSVPWSLVDKTVSSIADITTRSHTALSDIGANTHAQIDSHISDLTVHFTVASIDHGSITGLLDDDHTQYVKLAGRATGQTLIGGTAASDGLTLKSTSDATKGPLVFSEANDLTLVLAGTAPNARKSSCIDLQCGRAAASYTIPTTAGEYNAILGGRNNSITSTGTSNVLVGGIANQVSGASVNCVGNFVGGGNSNVISSTGYYNGILAGSYNTLSSTAANHNVMAGGTSNTISAASAVCCGIFAGESNEIKTGAGITHSVIVGGKTNTITGAGELYSAILGGLSHSITATGGYNTVIGSTGSTITNAGTGYNGIFASRASAVTGGAYGVICGGQGNQITAGGHSGILSGQNNEIRAGYYHGQLGGYSNLCGGSATAYYCAQVGGSNNTINTAGITYVFQTGYRNTSTHAHVAQFGAGSASVAQGDFLVGNNYAAGSSSADNNHFRLAATSILDLGNATNQAAVSGGAPELRVHTANANQQSNYVGIKASPSTSVTYTIIMPQAAGTAGQALKVASVSGTELTMEWYTP